MQICKKNRVLGQFFWCRVESVRCKGGDFSRWESQVDMGQEIPECIRGNEHREGFKSGAPVERSLCSLEMGERANALEIENRAARGGKPRVIGDTEEL